jgi:methionyl-tRNA formyltransferase
MTIRDDVIHPTVLATGYRGAVFVSGLLNAGVRPARVWSYGQKGDQSGGLDSLIKLCRGHGISLGESERPQIRDDELVFVVGWQFLLNDTSERCVVFHDSLLPKFRGFSPTVTALLAGEEIVGVTAIQPTADVDAGPIYGSRTVRVPPGAPLRAVFDLQTAAMVELAVELAELAFRGALKATPQEEDAAVYSLWRDAFDYFIDWRRDAQDVVRHVLSVGFPYEGAKAILNSQLLTIVSASVGPNIAFAIRDPGKLWKIEDGRALIVCGGGTVWIEEAVDADGRPYKFKRLRSRFLTADTAWISRFVIRK